MEDYTSHSIPLSELPSITNAIKRVLSNNRIMDVNTLSITELNLLVALGIDSDVGLNLLEEADILMKEHGVGFIMGDALLKQFDDREILTTGCSSLDTILGGGLSTQKLYEFFGKHRVGKTNFLHQILCRAIAKWGVPVLYYDAEDNFDMGVVRNFACHRFSLDADFVKKNIALFKVNSSKNLLYGLEDKLITALKKTGARVILLDSITTNVREEYLDRKLLPERQGLLNKIAHALKRGAQAFNAVAVVINQVTRSPNLPGYTFSGGNILGHEVQFRIEIKTLVTAGDQEIIPEEEWNFLDKIRMFFVHKGVNLPRDSRYLKITDVGFVDLTEDELKQLKKAKAMLKNERALYKEKIEVQK